MKKLCFLLLFISVFGTSCKKDTNSPNDEPVTTTETDTIYYFSAPDPNPHSLGLFSIESNGNHKTHYDNFPTNLQIRELDYSPATQQLVFTTTDPSTFGIFTINLDGSNLTKITNDTINRSSPKFSQDGSKILFLSVDLTLGTTNIFVMNSDGSNVIQLPETGLSPANVDWTNDNLSIVFVGGFEAYSMKLDGSNLTKLTDSTLATFDPQFSSDGNQIAFGAYHPSNPFITDLFRINKNGNALTNLTNFQRKPYSISVRNPQWSKKSKELIFISDIERGTLDGKRDLFIINNNGDDFAKLDTLVQFAFWK